MCSKNFIFAFFFLSILCLCTQCKPGIIEEDETSYQAAFYVRYLADTEECRGQASFFDQDSVSLEIPGGVAFMGSGTREKKLPGDLIRYEANMRIPYQSVSRFNLKIPGTEANSEIQLPMSGILGFSITEASKKSGLRLTIDGTITEEESLLLLFSDPNQQARTIVRPGPVTQETLFIPADALSLFIPGSYRLYLVKRKQIIGKEKNLNYEASIEFYSNEQAFELTE